MYRSRLGREGRGGRGSVPRKPYKAVDVEMKEVEEGLIKLTVTPVKPRESFKERKARIAERKEVGMLNHVALMSPKMGRNLCIWTA